MKAFLEKIGLIEPQTTYGRTIYLSDGTKVIAPPKPDKIRVSYSVIPENSLSLEDYITQIKLRRLEPSSNIIRKFYL